MSSAPMNTARAITATFGDVLRALNRPMNTIEDVSEIEEYVNLLPNELAELQV